MGRRLMGRIRLPRGLSLEVVLEVGWCWLERFGIGRWFQDFVAEMERMLGVSEGWMLCLFVAGNWIPSSLAGNCK